MAYSYKIVVRINFVQFFLEHVGCGFEFSEFGNQ